MKSQSVFNQRIFIAFAVILILIVLGLFVFRTSADALVGDLNHDGVVKIDDLSILLSDWGTNNATADLNSDHIVNIGDLSMLLSHWGETAPAPTAQVTVTPGNNITAVPSNFMGISFEMKNACQIVSWDNSGAEFDKLLENLGPSLARIGGNSVDQTSWDTSGTPYSCSSSGNVMTPTLVNDLFAVASKVGWKYLWSLNLAANNPTTYSDEAADVVGAGGSNLYALAIGNEPDLYSQSGKRTSGYTYNNFQSEWDAYKNAITALDPSASLSGNDDCCNDTWLTSFATNESAGINMLTKHYYPTSTTSSDPSRAPTLDNLLSSSLMQTAANNFDSWGLVASTHGLPLSIDETNSASGGGVAGVSNTLGAALWGSDYLFTALEHKVSNIDFHTGSSPSIYSPIDTQGRAAALYYAMLLFHYAAPDGHSVATSVSSSYNITAHSVVSNDGKLHVVLINKDQSNSVTVQLNTTNTYTQASEITLTAPAVNSTSGITLGGAAVASDGTWAPTPTAVSLSGATAQITVSPASAVVVTLQ